MRYLIIVAMLAVAGCEQPQNVENQIEATSYIVRTVSVKGHEYIIFDGSYKGNIIHSESCQCKKGVEKCENAR